MANFPPERGDMAIGRTIQLSTWPCLQTVLRSAVPWPAPPTLLSIMKTAPSSERAAVALATSTKVTTLSWTELS